MDVREWEVGVIRRCKNRRRRDAVALDARRNYADEVRCGAHLSEVQGCAALGGMQVT